METLVSPETMCHHDATHEIRNFTMALGQATANCMALRGWRALGNGNLLMDIFVSGADSVNGILFLRFSEYGIETAVGKGLWATAGKVLLKRSAIDTGTCGTATQAISEENNGPIIFGLRLELNNVNITEIEHIIAREKDFAFTPKGILDTANQDWEGILKLAERSSRLAMTAAAVDYFDMFADDPVVSTPFATPCDRWENGMQTTKGGEFQGKIFLKKRDT